MKKSKREIREIIEKADQERRHRQYQIIQEVDGSLDNYIDSCYCLPDEYLKEEKHINWLNYEGENKEEETE
jgi:hypothetical protein